MTDKVLQIGDVKFVADADLHYEKALEIGERVVEDVIIHPDGRKGMFINDEDLAYLLAACAVLSVLLSEANDESLEDMDYDIPDLPGRKVGSTSVH